MIRELVNTLAKGILPSFGVRPKDIDIYRDVLLSVFAIVPIFLASKPIFFSLDGTSVDTSGIEAALIWLIVAVLISLLSINWTFVLGIAFSVVATRGIVGLSIRIPAYSRRQIGEGILMIAIYGILGAVFYWLKPYKRSIHKKTSQPNNFTNRMS